MTIISEQQDRAWFKERIMRHGSEMFRLALPISMSRLGVMMLGIVDTAVVGRYATEHLAWLNLANQAVIMLLLVIGLGILNGVVVMTASAYGRGDYGECGQVWRRSIPFSLGFSVLLILVCWPAEWWLLLLGQTADNAEQAGVLIRVLVLGLPAHLLFYASNSFLEGTGRAVIGFKLMVAANIVNLFFDYALVFGAFGFPEMGSEGSAWTSTIVRWFLASLIIAYIWFSPKNSIYGVRIKGTAKWRDWVEQRTIGYASATSMATEMMAFAAVVVFAGWLGIVPLAAYGIIFQLLAVPFMMASGFGVAGSIRVGISLARYDRADTVLGGLLCVGMNVVLMMIFSSIMIFFTGDIMGLFTADPAVMHILVPLIGLVIIMMLFDAFQGVLSNLLRGLKETWVPTAIQTVAYIGLMLPLSYYLGIALERGVQGLIEGATIASIFSLTSLSIWFAWITRAKSLLFIPKD